MLGDRQDRRDVVAGMRVVGGQERVVEIEFAHRDAVRPGRPFRRDALRLRQAEHGRARLEADGPSAWARALATGRRADRGRRDRGIVDDAVADHLERRPARRRPDRPRLRRSSRRADRRAADFRRICACGRCAVSRQDFPLAAWIGSGASTIGVGSAGLVHRDHFEGAAHRGPSPASDQGFATPFDRDRHRVRPTRSTDAVSSTSSPTRTGSWNCDFVRARHDDGAAGAARGGDKSRLAHQAQRSCRQTACRNGWPALERPSRRSGSRPTVAESVSRWPAFG